MMTTWRKALTKVLVANDESFSDLIACTLCDAGLDRNFNVSYGGAEGEPFTAWTANRVYFPAVYDGLEWVESVPRNPCDEAMHHVGGQ